MKNVRLIITVILLFGIAGCSTPTPNSAISHQPSFATRAVVGVEEAKQLYEMGNIEAAKQKLLTVLAIEPNNRAALYYLTLIKEEEERSPSPSPRRPKPWGFYPTFPPKPIYQ